MRLPAIRVTYPATCHPSVTHTKGARGVFHASPPLPAGLSGSLWALLELHNMLHNPCLPAWGVGARPHSVPGHLAAVFTANWT